MKNQCIAILTKGGKIGWTWKTSFVSYTPELRSDIVATSLFFVKDGQVDADIQKLAEKAIATEASRWAGVQPPDEE